MQSPSGPVRLLAPGMIFDGVPPRLGPVPAVGEHSERLREEFGGGTARAAGL